VEEVVEERRVKEPTRFRRKSLNFGYLLGIDNNSGKEDEGVR